MPSNGSKQMAQGAADPLLGSAEFSMAAGGRWRRVAVGSGGCGGAGAQAAAVRADEDLVCSCRCSCNWASGVEARQLESNARINRTGLDA